MSTTDDLINRMARTAKAEIRRNTERALVETHQRFDALQRFTIRSHGQIRRFFVARQLREKANRP